MKRTPLVALVSVILIVVLGIGAAGYAKRQGWGTFGIEKDSGSNISDYSAVFLTNGQVYFGKIYARTHEGIDLRDIYYLQVNNQSSLQSSPSPSASPSASPEVSLIKLGNELHGPNDRMLINMQQVLFTESLKDDSKVVAAIKNYTSK